MSTATKTAWAASRRDIVVPKHAILLQPCFMTATDTWVRSCFPFNGLLLV
jgi:hypothetical protein